MADAATEGPTAAEIEAARKLFAGPCDFFWGAAAQESLPPISTLPEIAFAGRSNVGKSSLVNALTGRRTLARVSARPGHTRQINFFIVSWSLSFTPCRESISSQMRRSVGRPRR